MGSVLFLDEISRFESNYFYWIYRTVTIYGNSPKHLLWIEVNLEKKSSKKTGHKGSRQTAIKWLQKYLLIHQCFRGFITKQRIIRDKLLLDAGRTEKLVLLKKLLWNWGFLGVGVIRIWQFWEGLSRCEKRIITSGRMWKICLKKNR